MRGVGHLKRAPWKRVIFASECDEDGNCPVCGVDYAECDCPGPTLDGCEYKTINGVLYGRKKSPRR